MMMMMMSVTVAYYAWFYTMHCRETGLLYFDQCRAALQSMEQGPY